ncbi:TPA: restriction endonuclease subunit S [Vibrio parahaemolyticus]|nr:restriction endonuclease subunit S [Vibrio parahaemolyticus]
MTGRYKAYPEYKNSGVEWLKEIPIHWDCKKLKFFLNDLVRGPFGSALKKEFFTTAGIKVYEQKNCIQNNVALGESYISEDTYRDLIRFAVTNGDLLMSCSGTIGKIVEVTEPYEKGIINQALLIMRINGSVVNKAFFKHIFRSEDVQKQIKDNTQGGAMQNLVATDIFKSVSFTVPSYEEQQKIANFLDHETAKIDTLIDKQEKLIELLKEKRQAVISHAVTKGLNPDAPLKDSGVEWLGEVPEHWGVGRVKDLTKLISKGTTPSTIGGDFIDEGIRFLKGENIGKSMFVNSSPTFYISEEIDAQLSRSRLEENDVLVIIAGATTGKASILTKELLPANTNQAVSFVRPKKSLFAKLIALWLSTDFAQRIIWMGAVQAAQPNLSMEDLGNIPIVFPPENEIASLLSNIDERLKQFDSLILKATNAIELMKERKTALISAAVTGKIDVR